MPTQKKRTGAADEVNVTNVKVLPISNSNTQLENGNIGTGNISTLATFSLPPLGTDFKAMTSGTHNLGSLLFDETRTKLVKVNNHVTMTGKNNVSISN